MRAKARCPIVRLALSACPGLLLWAAPVLADLVQMPNLAPHQLVFLQPPAVGPDTVPAGKFALGLNLAYATIYSSNRSGDAAALFDMEVARVALQVAWGIGTRSEVGVEATQRR